MLCTVPWPLCASLHRSALTAASVHSCVGLQVRRAALNLLGEDEGAQRATASVLLRVGNNGYFGQVWFGRSPQAAT